MAKPPLLSKSGIIELRREDTEGLPFANVRSASKDAIASVTQLANVAREIIKQVDAEHQKELYDAAAAAEHDCQKAIKAVAVAQERAAEFTDADTQTEQDAAFMNLRVLMEDTVMLAPLAASAAADRADERNIALR